MKNEQIGENDGKYKKKKKNAIQDRRKMNLKEKQRINKRKEDFEKEWSRQYTHRGRCKRGNKEKQIQCDEIYKLVKGSLLVSSDKCKHKGILIEEVRLVYGLGTFFHQCEIGVFLYLEV